MRQFTRGTTVDFSTTFLSSSGDVLTVDSASVTITYPEDAWPLDSGRLISTTYDMVGPSVDQEWTYAWDSTLSGPGYVYWMMAGNSADAQTETGQFLILSNFAADFVFAPNTSSNTDYV